ncbi:hypothetical protein FBY10_1201, partial [Pseudomonas sp. SJZ103]
SISAGTKGVKVFDELKPLTFFTPESLARQSQR